MMPRIAYSPAFTLAVERELHRLPAACALLDQRSYHLGALFDQARVLPLTPRHIVDLLDAGKIEYLRDRAEHAAVCDDLYQLWRSDLLRPALHRSA